MAFDARHEPLQPCEWEFPNIGDWPTSDLVTAGADLEPATVITGYSKGMFPMGIHTRRGDALGWWSPVERGVLPLDGFHVSGSLRKSIRKFETRIDTCFETLITMCAELPRDGRWITPEFISAYTKLHELGYAHSVEVFRNDELVGGLYGVRINGFFAGESMFHIATDASKVALWRLTEEMKRAGMSLLDVQWQTPHLESLGVIKVSRLEYLQKLSKALEAPNLGWSR